jgi:F-type H+-transporting ATPase subunit b
VPQFEPSVFLPQLFWLSAIFGVLYFFVIRPTLPKVGRVIEERETRVAGDLDAAEAAKGEADRIRAAYDEGMMTARKAAQAEVAAARDAAARAAEARLAALTSELDTRIDAAVSRLAAQRDAARTALAATAVTLTSDAVMRVAGLEVPAGDIEAALAAEGVRNG